MKDLFWRLLTCIGIQRGLPDCHWWVLKFISRYNPAIWVESRGWLLWKNWGGYRGTQQHTYRGRRYYILRGVGGRIWWCKLLWRKVLWRCTWVNPKCFSVRGWKIFMDIYIGVTYSHIATRLLMDKVHEPQNALSKFMDLSDTNYKFMDLKIRFHSLWT